MEKKIIDFLDSNRDIFIDISQKIHQNPEIGNEEYFAADLLTKFLENKGFNVERDIAGHETGFIARKKSKNGGNGEQRERQCGLLISERMLLHGNVYFRRCTKIPALDVLKYCCWQ